MNSEFENAYESITELKCPHGSFFDCWVPMDRDELKAHLRMHPKEEQSPEHYWQLEAEHRFEQGPYWTKYNAGTKYAA